MFAIIGLGNPGEEYAQTRHNAGFQTIDILANELGVLYWKSASHAQVGKAKLALSNGEVAEVLLVKPQTFMNLSGEAVKGLCKEYALSASDLIVVHDDLDISASSLRIKMGGGHAGHNGLRSIIEKLGTRDFLRVRVGIGRPPGKMKPARFVLMPLRDKDYESFCAHCDRAAQAIKSLLEVGLTKTQNQFNQ